MTWNKEGVPHRGWRCIDVEDLADLVDGTEEIPYEQCEMCGNERIRFVHLMQHPDYPHELRVGCVCAEKMSDDYVNPRKAEDTLRKRLHAGRILTIKNGDLIQKNRPTAKNIRANILP